MDLHGALKTWHKHPDDFNQIQDKIIKLVTFSSAQLDALFNAKWQMLACLRNKLRTDSLAVWFFLLSLASVSMLIPYGNVPFQLIQNSGVKLFQS